MNAYKLGRWAYKARSFRNPFDFGDAPYYTDKERKDYAEWERGYQDARKDEETKLRNLNRYIDERD